MALSTYTYEQLGFGTELGPLTGKEKDALDKSWAVAFASDIFPYIDEKIFAPLYSERKSRRNVPVNVLAGAMLLQEIRGMSDEDLVEAAMFDLRLRTALHITNAVGQPLSLRTIQRFRTRLKRHRESSGEDLLGICFDGIGDRLESFLQKYAKYMVNAARTAEENRKRRMAKDRQHEEEKGQTAPGENPDHAWTKAETNQAEIKAETNMAETSKAGAGTETGQALSDGNWPGEKVFDLSIIADPDRIRENCLPVHSNHLFFADEVELARGARQPAGTAGRSVFRFSLNGSWKFSCAAKPAEAAAGFESPDYDCHLWADIRVPSNIEMEGYGVIPDPVYQDHAGIRENIIPGQDLFDFNPTASYVKYFCLSSSMKRFVEEGSPLIISFQGVEGGFALWCNGHYVGYSEDCFAPSEFDLTPFLAEGENTLAVRVFGRTSSSRQDSRDHYRFSGIFRDVYLYTVPAAHLFDLRILPEPDENLETGRLKIEAQVQISKPYADREKSRKQRLRLYYALKKGEEQVLEGSAAVNGTESCKVRISEELASPALWSAEDPQLYDLILRLISEKREEAEEIKDAEEKKEIEEPKEIEETKEIKEEIKETEAGAADESEKTEAYDETGQVLLEIVREKVAFRRFGKKDGRIYLNGKKIFFRGVDYREFSCDSGHAVPADTVYQDLLLMKKININAVRTGRHPHSPALDRFCDELGIYLVTGDFPESDTAERIPAESSANVNCSACPALCELTDQGEFIPEFIEPSIRLRNRYGEDFLAYRSRIGEDMADGDPDNSPGSKTDSGIIDGMRRPYAGRMQETAYHYQSIRLQVGRDRVLIRNDNLFTSTDRYDCVVCLDREGERIAETLLITAVPPLSEEEYTLPQAILQKIQQIGAEKTSLPVEYAVTVSMRLRRDCAWAEKGYETAFGQGVFLTEKDTVSDDETETVSGCGNETASDTGKNAVSLSNTDMRQPALSEGAVEIRDTDETIQFAVRTSCGWLDLTRGPGHIGIRGDSFEALFSLAQGGIVSFRRGSGLYPAGSLSGGSARDGRSSFAGAELFEKMPRPCFWRVPSGNDAGKRQAAQCGIWKLAEEYLIPRRETLKILAEDECFFLHLEYQLPFSGGSAAAGYRFYGDGRLIMSLEWVPDRTGSGQHGRGDDQEGLFPAIPPLPVFGFSFRLNPDLDRFTFYGNGPAENYAGCNRGARLGIYSCKVTENMTHHPVPQECGSRSGVRWACVTDRLGRGIRFTAGSKEGIFCQEGRSGLYAPSNAPLNVLSNVPSDALSKAPSDALSDASLNAPGRAAMEFSALPYSHQELEAASHPYELPPVHYTNVRCALMQTDSEYREMSPEDGSIPPRFLPADRKLYFEVTVEGI